MNTITHSSSSMHSNSNSMVINSNSSKPMIAEGISTYTHKESISILQAWDQDKDTKDFTKNDDIETMAYEKGLPELVDELNALYNPLNLSVSFAYNEDIRALYVQVRRIDTDEVIRQIPSEEAIELMQSMRELQGAIFDIQA